MTRMNGKHVPSLVMTLEGQLVTTSRLVFTDRNLNWRHQAHSSRIICAPKSRLVMKKTLVTIEDGF
jgi:hypothetical protein